MKQGNSNYGAKSAMGGGAHADKTKKYNTIDASNIQVNTYNAANLA